MKRLTFTFLCTLISSISFPQWTNNSTVNTPVCQMPYDQKDPGIKTDGQGGAIIVWADNRDSTTNGNDIYIQLIDSSGNIKWNANGIPVCQAPNGQKAPALVVDGPGSAIIAWHDQRNGIDHDIYVQKVNNDGIVQWTTDGVAVAAKNFEQTDPKIISDGAGGAIIVWQDSVNAGWDIYAQRVSSAGTALWTTGGVIICNAASSQTNPKIETDGAGGAIIVWQDKRSGDFDIYAQRINATGITQWTVNGTIVCAVAGVQNGQKIEPDGSGGAIIAWEDKRSGNYDVYAQRLNSSGISQWTANGIAVSIETGNQTAIDISSDNISGAIITWKDYRNNIYADIYAQYIDISGTKQWTTNGIPISTKVYDQQDPNVVTDNSGAIIIWQDSSNGQWDLYAQKILLNGTAQWVSGGKAISNAPGSQTNPRHINDGKGGAIVVWQDKRDGTWLDVYTQNINSDGSLGVVGINETLTDNCRAQVFPNPNKGEFIFQNAGCAGDTYYELKIFNTLGRQVFFNPSMHENDIFINLSSLERGVYFYHATYDNNSLESGKIVVR